MTKVRRTKAQWQQLVEGQADSGLTISDYCASHGITVSGFYQWRKKLQSTEAVQMQPESWLSFASPPQNEQGNWQIELALPGGVVLRMNAVA